MARLISILTGKLSALPSRTEMVDYAITEVDCYVRSDAAGIAQMELPPISSSIRGHAFIIKRLGSSGNVDILPVGGDTIDGLPFTSLTVQYQSIMVFAPETGTNWDILVPPEVSGSSGGGAGHAVVNFGAFPGSTDATVTITGQGGIVSGSVVRAWLRAINTTDHTADEHIVMSKDVQVIAGNIISGVGFTIYVVFNSSYSNFTTNADAILLNASKTRVDTRQGNQITLPTVLGLRTYGEWAVSWEWK